MKFLIDAQLPRRLAHQLRAAGFETTHTLDLPEGNRTSDQALLTFSLTQYCVVVTKDSDFVESFLLRHEPWKLLLLCTGNKRVGVTRIQLNRFSKIQSGAIKIAFLIAEVAPAQKAEKVCSRNPQERLPKAEQPKKSCEQSASVATDFSEAINSWSLLSDRDPKKGASDVYQKKRSVLPLRILC